MATENQIESNRKNAAKSTGPKTPKGKTKVSQNALRRILPGENPTNFKALKYLQTVQQRRQTLPNGKERAPKKKNQQNKPNFSSKAIRPNELNKNQISPK
jgi:hypothetical protein